MTAKQDAEAILAALAWKRQTKAEHDSVMANATPGSGVTAEMMRASSVHADAAVRLAAATAVEKVERLAVAYLELLQGE